MTRVLVDLWVSNDAIIDSRLVMTARCRCAGVSGVSSGDVKWSALTRGSAKEMAVVSEL